MMTPKEYPTGPCGFGEEPGDADLEARLAALEAAERAEE